MMACMAPWRCCSVAMAWPLCPPGRWLSECVAVGYGAALDDFSVADNIVLPWMNGSFKWRTVGLRDVFPHNVLQLCNLVESPSARGDCAPPPRDPVVVDDSPPPRGEPQGRPGHVGTSSLRSAKPAAKKATVATCHPPPPSQTSCASWVKRRAVHFVRGGAENSRVRLAVVDGARDRWLVNAVEMLWAPIAWT